MFGRNRRTATATLEVCGAFDATTGNLVQIFDSFSKYPGRWGYVHGPIHALGKYHSLTLDQPYPASASPSNTLYGPFEMAVTAVNRAGYGQIAELDHGGRQSGNFHRRQRGLRVSHRSCRSI